MSENNIDMALSKDVNCSFNVCTTSSRYCSACG